jgi:hypothetical protein
MKPKGIRAIKVKGRPANGRVKRQNLSSALIASDQGNNAMKNSGFFLRTGAPDAKVKLPNKFLCAAAALSLLTFLFVSCSIVGAAEDIILPAHRIAIPEYNLEKYIPFPRGGEYPIMEQEKAGVRVTINWTDEQGRKLSPDETFTGKIVYKADINLKIVNPREYCFDEEIFFRYDKGKVKVEPRDDPHPEERNISVTYKPAEPEVDADVPVTNYDLDYFVSIPRTGDIVSETFQRPDVTVTVAWEEEDGEEYIRVPGLTRFRPKTVYWATITLEARTGKKNVDFDLVPFEYVFDERQVFQYPNNHPPLKYLDGTDFDRKIRKLRVEYPPTEYPGEEIDDLSDLMSNFPGPKAGKVLDWGFVGEGYVGTIKKWLYLDTEENIYKELPKDTGKYQPETVYKAEIELTPSSGYYFDKNLTVKYGDKTFEFKYSYREGTLSGTIEFPVTDTAITGVIYLDSIIPQAGNPWEQSFPDIDERERFKVDVEWRGFYDDNECLIAGRAYYMYITLTAKEGYCFFDGLKPTVKYNALEKQLDVDESGNPKEMGMGEIQCQ